MAWFHLIFGDTTTVAHMAILCALLLSRCYLTVGIPSSAIITDFLFFFCFTARRRRSACEPKPGDRALPEHVSEVSQHRRIPPSPVEFVLERRDRLPGNPKDCRRRHSAHNVLVLFADFIG